MFHVGSTTRILHVDSKCTQSAQDRKTRTTNCKWAFRSRLWQTAFLYNLFWHVSRVCIKKCQGHDQLQLPVRYAFYSRSKWTALRYKSKRTRQTCWWPWLLYVSLNDRCLDQQQVTSSQDHNLPPHLKFPFIVCKICSIQKDLTVTFILTLNLKAWRSLNNGFRLTTSICSLNMFNLVVCRILSFRSNKQQQRLHNARLCMKRSIFLKHVQSLI